MLLRNAGFDLTSSKTGSAFSVSNAANQPDSRRGDCHRPCGSVRNGETNNQKKGPTDLLTSPRPAGNLRPSLTLRAFHAFQCLAHRIVLEPRAYHQSGKLYGLFGPILVYTSPLHVSRDFILFRYKRLMMLSAMFSNSFLYCRTLVL